MSDLSIELFEMCTHWPELFARLSDAHLNIRKANRRDALALQHVVFTVLREYGLPVEPDGTDVDLADVDAHYNDRDGLFVTLVDDAGEVLGTAGIYPMDETTCELRKMYFLPPVRGLGLGKRLVQVLMGWAATQGFEVMTLETATCLSLIHI